MTKEQTWDEKYKMVSFTGDPPKDYGEFENWKIEFFLLTEDEILDLAHLTKKRMIRYNTKIKPKDWAGYVDKDGEEIR